MITASEAYAKSQAAMVAINCGDAMLDADRFIRNAMAKGAMATIVRPLELLVAEKAALELQALGFNTTVVASTIPFVGDSYELQINWKYFPHHTRQMEEGDKDWLREDKGEV